MIGVFDSGLGGLAILRRINELLPGAGTAYFADSGAFPYGPRPAAYLRQRTSRITEFLLDRGARVIVVACNTATVVAIRHLRDKFDVPFVGVEPAVKVAASAPGDSGPIFVLMTENTAAGEKYAALVREHAPGREVRPVCLPLLAKVVEDGTFREPDTAAQVGRLVRNALGAELRPGARVVLGCTHYVFLEDILREALGPGVEILEPSRAVARQVKRVLERGGILPMAGGTGKREFFCTGDREEFERGLEGVGLGRPMVSKINLTDSK